MTEAQKTDALLLQLDSFEGPIDVLLQLARDQKVDLTQISILQLARQYLAFIDRAVELSLDVAAEYLVMAAWLAYLKSRLLLPKRETNEEEPSAEMMAEALAYQLRRYEAIQAGSKKMARRMKHYLTVYGRGLRRQFQKRRNLINIRLIFIHCSKPMVISPNAKPVRNISRLNFRLCRLMMRWSV